jgi:hypothetical protein
MKYERKWLKVYGKDLTCRNSLRILAVGREEC